MSLLEAKYSRRTRAQNAVERFVEDSDGRNLKGTKGVETARPDGNGNPKQEPANLEQAELRRMQAYRSGSTPVSITAFASISPLGVTQNEIWEAYGSDRHCFKKKRFSEEETWVASLSDAAHQEMDEFRNSEAKYRHLDDSVIFALHAARRAIKNAGWSTGSFFGINIGSSRGATSLFEKYHEEFLLTQRAATLSSPTTTLGNISSWVAHDLQATGPDISHSITCSTALHALLNGVAWIKGGMAEKFLVGGSEAPLTPFTLAQMKALKIYASPEDSKYPCQALNLDKKRNSMILGEGASLACMEAGIPENALAIIEGVGYATEPLRHNTSISTDALCFQRSMRMALGQTDPGEIDAMVMHAPGTVKGDLSEFKAIEKIFRNKLPALTTNKWKTGHTFGASGMLSIEMALLMLYRQQFLKVPFVQYTSTPKRLQKIMVNAVGFGGNAVSILLSKS